MSNKHLSRSFLSLIIFLLYLLPVFAFSVYSIGLIPNQDRWVSFGLGIFFSVVGSTVLFIFLNQWQSQFDGTSQELPPIKYEEEKELPNDLPDETQHQIQGYIEEIEQKQKECLQDIQNKEEELQKLYTERNQLNSQFEKMAQEFDILQRTSQETLLTKNKLQEEYLNTITEQRELIEKQEQHILEKEGQIRDLQYEIKTLIQVNDYSHEDQIRSHLNEETHLTTDSGVAVPLYTPETLSRSFQSKHTVSPVIEANLQLRRCIDIAQKITGTSLFSGESSRYRDLSVNSYSLDLRRLFDSLRSENSNTILLYSQKEEKLLFANNQTKNLLGWSPEKFIQDFPELIVEGANEWQRAINQLTSKNETQISLVMKNKSGENLTVQCHIGAIPTGIFKSHVIGVLYQA